MIGEVMILISISVALNIFTVIVIFNVNKTILNFWKSRADADNAQYEHLKNGVHMLLKSRGLISLNDEVFNSDSKSGDLK